MIRETLEETGTPFTPEGIVGIYQLKARNGRDYCRIGFCGTVPADAVARPQPGEILACHWLTRAEIAAGRPRSSLVLKSIDDYLAGRRFPLSLVDALRDDRTELS